MLTTKQIARNTFVTYCSTRNTLFTHTSKVRPRNISFATADAFVKNAAEELVAHFKSRPSLYTLKKG